MGSPGSAFDSCPGIYGNVLNMICISALLFSLSFQRKLQDTFVESRHLKFYYFGLYFFRQFITALKTNESSKFKCVVL